MIAVGKVEGQGGGDLLGPAEAPLAQADVGLSPEEQVGAAASSCLRSRTRVGSPTRLLNLCQRLLGDSRDHVDEGIDHLRDIVPHGRP